MSEASSKPVDTADFWKAPPEARFNQKVVARVIDYSEAWLEIKRCKGGGIPFVKDKGGRVFYLKSDVLEWMGGAKKCASTSQYVEVRA
ncbi:MAG: DNA-binding protein [Betaproteobacteria bacterium]|nr:DNA-binding protein [Betaproteobacteria bacterium]